MMVFWIGSIVLLVISSIFILYPLFFSKTASEAAQRDELNKAFFKDRMQELESEVDAGIVANKEELIQDLKQSLLDDIPDNKTQGQTHETSVKWMAIPALIFMLVSSYGLYALYGANQRVSEWQQVRNQLPQLSKILLENPEQLTQETIDDVILSLRTRLHEMPDDAIGWLLLGRVAMSNRDINMAIGAFDKANTLSPNNPDILLSWSQAMLFSSSQADINKAKAILQQLSQQPNVDPSVYSLLAFDAYNAGEYTQAIQYWRQLQEAIGPEDERYAMIDRSIQTAQRELQALASPQQAAGNPMKVQVKLAETFTLTKPSTLIVSIHPEDGSSMPIAAASYQVETLPYTVVLDDRNTMIQGRKLSDFEKVIVRARIDSDGNVSTRDNDLYGESSVVALGQDVEVLIDKTY